MSQPITIRRYLTPAEGELARMRLAHDGIAGHLENSELLTWLWHYSNALKGVNLLVSSADHERAIEILAPQDALLNGEAAPAYCKECGEMFPTNWSVCWKCGTDVSGDRDESFLAVTTYPSRILEYVASINGLGLLLIAIVAVIIWIPPLAFALVFLLVPIAFYEALPPQNVVLEPEDYAALPDTSSVDAIGNEFCRRAMASAMFGIKWLSLFTLYSLWLLYVSHSMPVDSQGRRWRIEAWVLNIASIVIFASDLILIAHLMRNR
jgi:hypothetical protein